LAPTAGSQVDHAVALFNEGRYAESKAVFLDFWKEPVDSERFDHPGIYHEETFTDGERTVQVLLLDTRTFRDDLVLAGENSAYKNDYRPNPDPGATVLGEEQWRWLDHRLRAPADLRIIASSIQFGHSYNGWESWTNVPHERQKMIDVIRASGASGVLFISGDVHWGEISRQVVPGSYPLYDVTASGINQEWEKIEPNTRRVGPAVAQHNFGLVEVDWALDDPRITLRSIDESNAECNRVELRLSELQAPSGM
ncbi:MAG: alkaline phosphatase D family protein, partial [Planctomycetota bacterium]